MKIKQKKPRWIIFFFILSFIIVLVFLNIIQWMFACIIIIWVGVLMLIFAGKEGIELEKEQKEALMNKLNSREFKQIRVNDDEKNLLCCDKIWAKVSDNNEELIIVKIQYLDDNEKEVTSEIPFNKENFQYYIEEVIE